MPAVDAGKMSQWMSGQDEHGPAEYTPVLSGMTVIVSLASASIESHETR
jgi:hypothetical protein